MTRDVVILDGVRTAIGTFAGGLSSQPPTALGALVTKTAMERAGVEPGQIEHVAFGHVINTEPRDMYVSRVSAIDAGIPDSAPAMNVNRLCGSGAQAIVSMAQAIQLGDVDFALGGGSECMSRGPHSSQQIRSGLRMGDAAFTDMMVGALNCPFGTGHMGVTAENIATQRQISREDQDAFALVSQKRAGAAIAEGRFKDQIVPVVIKTRKGEVVFDTDEHAKPNTTAETLAGLRPAFKRDGTVTAGNASGINDGAAAVVLAEAGAAEKAGLKARARLVGYAHAGVDPTLMGLGPIPAVTKLMEKLSMSVDDFDVIEANEAFAAQAVAVNRALGLNTDKVNPNGGAIALGHPIGATGAILTVKCLAELDRIGGHYGLITMCIGGGQGIALAVERL